MKQTASANDSNRRPIGSVLIEVEFGAGRPIWIAHGGNVYRYTRTGFNLRTGETMHELATDKDARIWSNGDASRIEED